METSRQARWKAVYNAVSTAIDQGKLEPGDKVPTEKQLVDEHDAGRHSVREALAQLEGRGLISAARGSRGRTVLRYAPRPWDLTSFEVADRQDDPDVGDDWAAGIRANGETPHETVWRDSEQPTTDIAKFLQVSTTDWLMKRRRYRYADQELVAIADTWLLDEIAKLPATAPDGSTVYPFMTNESYTLPGGFIRAIGISQTWVQDLHFSRWPTLDEADTFGVRSDAPMNDVVRIGYRGEPGALSPFRVLHTVSPGRALMPRYWIKVQNP